MSVARRSAVATLAGMALSGAVILVLSMVLVAGCGSSTGGSSGAGSSGSSDSAPDFEVTTLAGDQASLGIYRGKPLVLAFMASW